MTLTKLGKKYGTDKVDEHHTFMGECYTDLYHHHLKHFRHQEFNFLEIGVRDGKSIKMWAEYFPNAKIVGVDIDPTCKQYESDNIEIHIGSQEDQTFLNRLISKYQTFRVILDDGSHINSMTLKSFKILQPFASQFYIIEDLRNSHEDLTRDVQSWPGMHLNDGLDADNSKTRPEMDKLFMDLVKSMDYRMGNWTGITFHAQMVLLQKGRISED